MWNWTKVEGELKLYLKEYWTKLERNWTKLKTNWTELKTNWTEFRRNWKMFKKNWKVNRKRKRKKTWRNWNFNSKSELSAKESNIYPAEKWKPIFCKHLELQNLILISIVMGLIWVCKKQQSQVTWIFVGKLKNQIHHFFIHLLK